MGVISNIYSLLDDYSPAMEADDITGDAISSAQNVTGNDDNDGEIDLNTDDILGTSDTNPDKNNDNTDADDENTDETSSDSNDDMNMDDNPDENSEDDSGEDLGDDSSLDSDTEEKMDQQEDPFSASRKKKLWGEFKAFYKVLEDSIKLITQYVPNISDAPTIKTMDNIKENLVSAKDIIYNILTIEYRSLSYPEMQKKYIGIHHIYDICTKELEKYFDKYRKEE